MKNLLRLIKVPDASYFLFGPRGTGKTTWLRSKYKDAEWINLLDPEAFRLYSARPERILDLVRQVKLKRKTFVIDEVQLVPQLLPAVHMLIEEDKETQFVLTGSSSRKLKRAGVDLLAGRAVLMTMHPFMACELGGLFDLDNALSTGLVPLVVSSGKPSEVLRSYASVYLKEEVKHEGLTRNIGDFSRFLEVISFSHGSDINASNIARECMAGRKAVESYISILEDLLIAFTIPAFIKKAERAPRAHPKFYLFDAGIYQSIRPSGPMDRPEEILGAALEGLVAQHLRSWLSYRGDTDRLHYWRTNDGAEVDFVIYGPSIFSAIEVKNSKRCRSEDFRGLNAFSKLYPQAAKILLYRGNESILENGIQCIPVDNFLRELNPASAVLPL
jgi:predicted AAA+ superfamily ATPase